MAASRRFYTRGRLVQSGRSDFNVRHFVRVSRVLFCEMLLRVLDPSCSETLQAVFGSWSFQWTNEGRGRAEGLSRLTPPPMHH
jgi:hypothetical protein